jgi:beta-galactosidase
MMVNGITITKHEFTVSDGSRSDTIFLLAGEFHYFRVAQSEWEDRLAKMEEIGCNAVSTYIPWNWHEEHEGKFDFSGPEKDLDLFLTKCEVHDLYILARPGPWICSEWAYGAIPLWLIHDHPEILCLDEANQPTKWWDLKAPPISYLHPLFLDYVRKWFEQVCPIIAKHEHPGGHVILVQPDNELSFMFHKYYYDVDYNPTATFPFYRAFLEAKYGSIDAINLAYGTSFVSVEEIEPPRRADEGGIRSLYRLLDWTECKEYIVKEYTSRLIAMFREQGIKSPMYVNTPLLDPPGNPVFQASAEQDTDGNSMVFVGDDIYPREFEAEAFTDWQIALSVGRLDAYFDYMPFSPEFEGGHFSIPVSPNETQIVSRLGLAHGLKALSIYMMVGGTNPPMPVDLKAMVDYPYDSYTTVPATLTTGGKMDPTGAGYDLLAPIGEVGDRNPRFEPFQRFFSFARANTAQLLAATKVSDDIAYLHHANYDRVKDNSERLDTPFDYNRLGFIEVTSQFYHFLSCTSSLHVQPKIVELTVVHGSETGDEVEDELDQYPVAFGYFFEFMDDVAIDRVRRFLDRGGTLIAFFDIPSLDQRFQPNNTLADMIPAKIEKKVTSGNIKMLGHVIDDADFALVYRDLPADAEVIGETDAGEPCAYSARAGNGRIIQLGFVLPPEDEGIALVDDLLKMAGVSSPRSLVSKPGVLAVQQEAADGERFAMIANLWPHDEKVDVQLAGRARSISSVISLEGVHLPARSCLVWAVQKKINEIFTIILATAEILSVDQDPHGSATVHGYNFNGASGHLWIGVENPPTCSAEFVWDEQDHVARIEHAFPAHIEFEAAGATLIIDFDAIDVPSD